MLIGSLRTQGIGWIIGPSVAGYLYESWEQRLGFSAPFVLGALLSLVVLVATHFLVGSHYAMPPAAKANLSGTSCNINPMRA